MATVKTKKQTSLKALPVIPNGLDEIPMPALIYFKEAEQFWNNGEYEKHFGPIERQLFYKAPKTTLHSVQQRPVTRDILTQEGRHDGYFLKNLDQSAAPVSVIVKKRADLSYCILIENASSKHELETQMIQTTLQLNQALTEIELKQKALIQSAKLASLGELTSGIAHELNQPLQAILGFSQELTHMEKLSPTGMEFLNDIVGAARKMKEIINSLRTFSRTSPQALEPISTTLCVQEALKLTQHQLHMHNIQVEVSNQTHSDIALGNAIQLEQVIINLVNNAKDAIVEAQTRKSFTGKIIITLQQAKNHLLIQVSDNGPGIPANIQDKIFDAFFTTKDPGKGTGLGLSISHSIIQSFGGTLTVSSEKSKGTQFQIALKTK